MAAYDLSEWSRLRQEEKDAIAVLATSSSAESTWEQKPRERNGKGWRGSWDNAGNKEAEVHDDSRARDSSH